MHHRSHVQKVADEFFHMLHFCNMLSSLLLSASSEGMCETWGGYGDLLFAVVCVFFLFFFTDQEHGSKGSVEEQLFFVAGFSLWWLSAKLFHCLRALSRGWHVVFEISCSMFTRDVCLQVFAILVAAFLHWWPVSTSVNYKKMCVHLWVHIKRTAPSGLNSYSKVVCIAPHYGAPQSPNAALRYKAPVSKLHSTIMANQNVDLVLLCSLLSAQWPMLRNYN